MVVQLLKGKDIDHESHLPKYIQLKEILIGLINSGEIKVGDKIPSLHQLTQSYKLSDTTCKKAISELVHQGVLKGEWGKGVFVQSKFPNTAVQNIALIVWSNSEILRHPAFSEVLNGMIEEVAQANYHLVFTFLDPGNMKKEEIEKRVFQINTSGVIIPFIPRLTEENLLPLAEKNAPVVFITKKFSAISPYLVRTNVKDALYAVTKRVLKSGRRKIAILGSPREELFREIKEVIGESLEGEGLTLDERFVKRGSRDFETGKKLMQELLNKKLIPDVVIADDDYVGYGALEIIQKKGGQLAHNIEIITMGGFLQNPSFRSRVSTIFTPYFKLGEETAKMMLNILKGNKLQKKEIVLPCTAQHRNSRGPMNRTCL